jgi:DNA-binding transcriptional LysR family regulator
MQSRLRASDPLVSWDDYRLLLATARTLSFQAAARELQLATSTVSRRIAALERRMGTLLFDRQPHGVLATAAGRLLASVAQTLEAELQRGEHQVGALETGLAGKVRLTAGEGFGDALVPMVAEFRALHPQIDVELAIDARIYDLAQGEADLAIRIPRPSERGLRVRKLGALRFGLYASATYLARHGHPRSLRELAGHDFIGFAGNLVGMAPARFLQELAVSRFAVRVNSTPLVRLSALCHLGIAVLSTTTSDLTRVLPAQESAALDVWLARHPSTAQVRRVSRLAEFLSAQLLGRAASG